MARRVGLIVSGSILIGLFLTWMLLKGTPAVQSWIDPNPMLGLAAWGIAWLCILGGAALIARAIYHRSSEPTAKID